MTRITQQDLLYRAQGQLPAGDLYPHLDAVQELLDGLRGELWWPAHCHRVEVHPLPADHEYEGTAAWYDELGAGLVNLRPDGLVPRTVCHELAHVVAEARHGERAANHGSLYTRTFLEVVFHVMGTEAWRTLRQSFIDNGVCFDEREDTIPTNDEGDEG